jgi:hypothetical protein
MSDCPNLIHYFFGTLKPDTADRNSMPVPDFKTYRAILDRARAGHFALLAVYHPISYLGLAETAMVERVKQAASDLRATGKTTCAA